VSAKFVAFTDPHTKKPLLVNANRVRTAYESGQNKVTLVMDQWEDGGFYQDVEGDLKSVQAKLMEPDLRLT
jgi:hypothetical protein